MIATSVIQPLDMIKVRIQLLGEGGAQVGSKNPVKLAAHVIKNEGFMSLYTGLSAGLLRQATYTTARMGLFRSISDSWAAQQQAPLAFWQKSVAGLAAGGLGAIFGTPADVSLIRMQADATLPVAERRNYKGVGNALYRITKEEGLAGLFSGNTPVVLRAMSLNLGMLATHDQAMESLKPHIANGALLSFSAKLISGFTASFFSLPFDFVKTRLQKQKKRPDGTLAYNGVMDCVVKVTKQEGAGAFYRGFWTYYVRIAPHAMITLVALDYLNAATKHW